MRTTLSIVGLTLAAIAGAAPAYACRMGSSLTPLLHQTLPSLPQDAIAAEVEITSDVPGSQDSLREARVIRMVRGAYRGTLIRIAPSVRTSCDGVPSSGTRGFVVGHVISQSEDILIVDPIRAPSQRQIEEAERLRELTRPILLPRR